LVLCAREIQPSARAYTGIKVFRCPLDDKVAMPAQDLKLAWQAAKWTAEECLAGRSVLVSCHLGLNRSGLVTGLALHVLTGMSGSDAAALIVSERPGALFNDAFLKYLCSVGEVQ
jgi:protein-tyrosine phosphatase